MTLLKSNKQRVIVLAAMIVIAALVAWLRFGRKPVAARAAATPTQAVQDAGMSDIDGLLARAERQRPQKPDTYPSLARNVFVPDGRLSGPGDAPDGAPVTDAGIPLRVTSIMIGAGGSLASVNGKLLREGESVGGYTIDKITREAVLFRRGSRTVALIPGQ